MACLVELDRGCNFRARCGFAAVGCDTPQQLETIAVGHHASCHRTDIVAGTAWRSAVAAEAGQQAKPAAPLVVAKHLTRSFRGGSLLSRKRSDFAPSTVCLVCDEAVSALDVSVQAAVLNLLQDLRDRLGLAYLFISRDIGVIAHIADRVIEMYRGRAVEEGTTAELLRPPCHPSRPDGWCAGGAVRIRLPGDPGSAAVGNGRCFATRCPHKLGTVCDTVPPPWQDTSAAHRLACHIPIAELAKALPQLPVAECCGGLSPGSLRPDCALVSRHRRFCPEA